jgi:isopentenyl-diphosphate delta-isomerase
MVVMPTETEPERIFVVDEDNLPLAVMAADQAHAQGLRHRGVLLVLTDRQDRLVLHRLPQDHPRHQGRWDVAGSGHIGAFEAAEEAAERHLPHAVLPFCQGLAHTATLPGGAGTGNEVTEVFEMSLPDQAAAMLAADLAFILVDRDELRALVASYPDQLTPDLLKVWRTRLHPPRG